MSDRHPKRPLSLLWLAVILSVAATGHVHAQYKGFAAVDQAGDLKSKLSAGANAIQSIKSDFVQEKHLSVLEETILSEGHFWFKRENKVRIDYVKPYRYLLIINGDQIIVRDENKENRMNTNSNKLFKQVNRIILDCVQGTILENKNFTNRLYQDDKSVLLEMRPLNQSLKEFFETIVVQVDKKDYSVSSIDLREPGGDHTLLRFTGKELNTNLDDAIFSH